MTVSYKPSWHDKFVPVQDIALILKCVQELPQDAQEYLLVAIFRDFVMPRWHGEFGKRLRLKSNRGFFQVWNGHKHVGARCTYTDKAYEYSDSVTEEWLDDIAHEARRKSA